MTAAKYVEPTGDQKAGYLHYRRPASPWELFQKEENIPVFKGIGMKDSRELPRAPFERMGGLGTYIQVTGTNNQTGMFVWEIPPRSASKDIRHFWEERFIVLEGRGSTEVWKEGSGAKTSFEWQPWSLFSVPMNAWFKVVNASSSPAILLAVNTAPPMINMFQSRSFIFNNPYNFDDRFGGNLEDYWKPGEELETHPVQGRAMIRSNLFPDAQTCYLPLDNNRAPGFRWISPNMVGNTNLSGFICEYPSGRYAKAHHHGSGAVLVCMRGKGYSFTWPAKEGGLTPWKDGKGDLVLRQDYEEGGMISAAPTPVSGETWFHQHFAANPGPFRIFNYTGAGGFVGGQPGTSEGEMVAGVGAEIGDGGIALPYHLEDPFVRKYFEERLEAEGAQFTMPPEVYTEAGANIKVMTD
ncbi:MAG: cupin [Dehalococcoidia bacterium]|nr:cupin [Dehalococcoidia bacterium]